MRTQNTIRLLRIVLALAFGWLAFDEPASNASNAFGVYSRRAQVDFERDIRPLLHARCAECHGANKQQSGLRLDRKNAALKGGVSGAVIIPGSETKPTANSELVIGIIAAPKAMLRA